MPYERLDSATQQLISCLSQLDGLAEVLAPEQLAGASAEERAARAELASDALQLLKDTLEAVESGERLEVVVALANAVDRLAVQLRDRVLDEVVASNPAPDRWPL
ncbi:hypothetical protein ABZ568_34865 [Streptomyces olindensis]|uniref:NTP pyrophosphohydrolase MazG putative catalytic core domain-containing protein n=1 Tax=Streptomyces olindensis TaxID=358823 RepID=A0ABV2Y5H4_9ACTN